jgi:hypothetical protein
LSIHFTKRVGIRKDEGGWSREVRRKKEFKKVRRKKEFKKVRRKKEKLRRKKVSAEQTGATELQPTRLPLQP